MSTKRPKPELSAHFIREKRILKAADTAKYNARLKEIDLPDDYAIYGYEPSSGRKPAAYWVCKQSVGECPECGTPYLEDAIASVSESKLTHYCRVEIPHEGRKPTYEIHPATLYLRRIRWLCYNCYSEQKTYNARMQDDSKLVDKEDKKLTLQVKEHLGQQAMHMEINTLAEIFDISPHTVDAGQFYTGRDIIKCLVAVLISEGCDDIFDDGKVVTVCDQACGTGGMLSTAYSFIKHYNPSADVRLFGQEFMPQSYAVGLAEMMIKGQNIENFRNADTFKEDCFPNIKMRFVLENPPFGTPWAGKDAKAGQEDAVRNEFKRGKKGRWGAGLPSGGDSQLIFMQSAIDKMDDKVGRAAIIENNSPLFTGGTASGESQIRRWILEQDLLEAIIALPTDLFYNTGIATYVWILSKNKRPERKGYVQLIDATSIFHKLRKAAGNKKNELLPEDRSKIVKLYTAFEKNEYCKIFKKEEFLYREYTVMQPLQRSYAITEERIDQMLADGTLNSVYDPAKVDELEEQGAQISVKDKMKLDKLYEQKPIYEAVISVLQDAVSDEIYLSPEVFMPVLRKALAKVTDDKKLLDKIADGLSVMDKNAEIQRDKHGAILYDKDSKDTERVPYEESIDDYMAREVLPHVPDAKAFWEEKVDAKKPVIKTGAEIPFTQYFYKYEQPVPSEELAKQFMELEQSVSQRIAKLFG